MRRNAFAAVLLALLAWQPAMAGESSARHLTDIVYAQNGAQPLALDLHLPAGVANPSLVVYVHGGGWRAGDKSQYPQFLLERGFAVASVGFRSTNDAPFPANVHDLKAAVRFLRAKAPEYGYRATNIAISGASSGGHLAALVGTTNGNAELEGGQGQYPGESSAVQAIVSWFGASNLSTILAQSTPFGLSIREPTLRGLLGGLPAEVPELAKLASPVNHVTASSPPAILLHGDQDPQMPVNQMLELDGAYRKAGLTAQTLVVHGAAHGGDAFYTGEPADRVITFLQQTIGRQ